MRSTFIALLAAVALLTCAGGAYALGGGPRHGNSSTESDPTKGPTSSVPEPSTLYALGSGLALLGGASWYIRRRK